MYLELTLPDAEPVVEISFSWFGKAANRMPEALWLSFQPATSDPRGWLLDKSGSSISPFDVVIGRQPGDARGSRRAALQGRGRHSAIETLDAPVVALGREAPVVLYAKPARPGARFHFSLFNNAWGTNYIQWFGEDMRFRFRIRA